MAKLQRYDTIATGQRWKIVRGDSFRKTVVLWPSDTVIVNCEIDTANSTPIDLTGASAALQVRRKADSASSLVDATCVVDGSAGTITATMTPAQTALIPDGALWDLQVELSGDVRTYIAGLFEVVKDVTR